MAEQFKPTPEFAVEQTDRARAAKIDADNLAISFYRVFESEDGGKILAWLERFTNRPVPLEQLPHGAVHKEGQRWLLHNIRAEIARGKRAIHGSETP